MKKLSIVILLLIISAGVLTGGTSYTKGTGTNLGTVRDNTTGLIWLQCPLGSSGSVDTSSACSGTPSAYTWAEARTACENLDFAGRTDWRLPAIKEIQSITLLYYNSAPRIDQQAFPENGNTIYWSDTTYIGRSQDTANNDSFAWCIDFSYGNPNPFDKSSNSNSSKDIRVRCVTGP